MRDNPAAHLNQPISRFKNERHGHRVNFNQIANATIAYFRFDDFSQIAGGAIFESSRREPCQNHQRFPGDWCRKAGTPPSFPHHWIEYFLLGLARTSEDALSRAARINAMLVEWQNSVSGESTKTPLRVTELLAVNPFVTAKDVASKLGVAFTTAQRAIERLEQLGIVQQVGAGKRDRVFCAKSLLDILEEPAQLTPGGH